MGRGRYSEVRERRASRQQLVQQDAERIDVTASVDVGRAERCLLWTHVTQRADDIDGGTMFTGELDTSTPRVDSSMGGDLSLAVAVRRSYRNPTRQQVPP